MESKKCPDCESEMTAINIIDKAYYPAHASMDYAAGDAKRGVWFGRYPIEGRIGGLLCGKCGRILLYAQPNEA